MKSTSAATTQPDSQQRWDFSADVVVLGYGGAGAVAAISAHDLGATTLILEKQERSRHISNTQLSLGAILFPQTEADAVALMNVAGRLNVERPETLDIDQEVIAAWARYAASNAEWLMKLGAYGFAPMSEPGRKADWPGLVSMEVNHLAGPSGERLYGDRLFAFLDRSVMARAIDVIWGAPASALIQDDRGQAIGVRAASDGGPIAVRAKRAVILACGGFEHNDRLLRTYLPIAPLAVGGNPANTGDGLRMAQEIGADLWHMAVMNGSLKMKFPDFPIAFEENFSPGGFIAVDRSGRRFKAENQLIGYSEFWSALYYDTSSYVWPRIPVHYVFDEKRRCAGPIVFTEFGAAGPLGLYSWSADNSAEIRLGWIECGDTLESLARKIGVNGPNLKDEVERFNDAARSGSDCPLGRPASSIAPIDTPPFYAVALWPGLNNTFGGPRRNASAQVAHVSGAIIPRLYCAGELGSIFVNYPQSGANLSECIAFGRIAGENAAREEPWTS
ncbi:MAG TPA: FAD-binding protein [Roseiarcus sp.]|nr:FAD-binding protein [Roseiarcus sp.]